MKNKLKVILTLALVGPGFLFSCQPTQNVADLGKTDPQYSVLIKQVEGMETVVQSWGLEKTSGTWTVTSTPGTGTQVRAWTNFAQTPVTWQLQGQTQLAFMSQDSNLAAAELKRLTDLKALIYTQEVPWQAPWYRESRTLPKSLVSELLLEKARWYFRQRLYQLVEKFQDPLLREEILSHLVDLGLENYGDQVLGKGSVEVLNYIRERKALRTISSLVESAIHSYLDQLKAEPDTEKYLGYWPPRALIFQRDFQLNYDKRFESPLYKVYGEKPPTLVQAAAWSSLIPKYDRPESWAPDNMPQALAWVAALGADATVASVFNMDKTKKAGGK